MEFRETLARRHSSRAYEATPVSDEALDTILAAGRAAPVGMGEYGTVHLTVVTGSEKMAELRKFRKPRPALRRSRLHRGFRETRHCGNA